jgi:hypothetical protein
MKYATSLPVMEVDTALPQGDAACYISFVIQEQALILYAADHDYAA